MLHFLKIHHFAWLHYPPARDWLARWEIAQQIRDAAAPDAVLVAQIEAGVIAFGDDAQTITEIMAVPSRDAVLLPQERYRMTAIPITSEKIERTTISEYDMWGAESSKDDSVIVLANIPALAQPCWLNRTLLHYRELWFDGLLPAPLRVEAISYLDLNTNGQFVLPGF